MVTAMGWQSLSIGGGGNVVGLDVNPTDGTFLHNGDVFGAWISTNSSGFGNW
jgi:hypothetical protein